MEVKLAMRMRHEGRMRETLVIDRKVCGSPGEAQEGKRYTCHSWLDRYLPPGAVLTIVEKDETVSTYEGRTQG